jgi:Delta3-Delta2-enoyl-CoA isomerase
MTTTYTSEHVTLTCRPDGVFTLVLCGEQNLINPPMVTELTTALSLVEAAPHPKALCVTAEGKFFSNGLDVTWMSENPGEAFSMIESFWRFLAQLLVLPCHTV